VNANIIPRESALFVSDVDEGGAAFACERIVTGINRLDGNACRWVVAAGSRETVAVNAEKWPSMGALTEFEICRRLKTGEDARTRAMNRFHETNVARIIRRSKPGVVCFHNIHQKMSFALLNMVSRRLPLVIDLHDMWYLTGYCCHSLACDKYLTGCEGECPQWGKWEPVLDEACTEWRRRERFFRRNAHRITFIAPSEWISRCAENRFDGKITVECIPNPVDTKLFRPVGEKRLVRQMLGLPQDKPLILCGAVTMKDPNKGAEYLRKALLQLRRDSNLSYSVCLFGDNTGSLNIPDAFHLGSVCDERLLNLFYNAATVFVLPSLAETFGLVFAEAISAGTPCVAFDNTACGEIVRENETGYLARSADADSLACALGRAIKAGDNSPLSLIGREFVVRKCDVNVVCKQYRQVLERVQAEAGGREYYLKSIV